MENGYASQTEDRLSKLLTEYHSAKSAFDASCQEFARASAAREASSQRLKKLSDQVQQAVASGLYDPTEPRPDTPCKPYLEYPAGDAQTGKSLLHR